MSYFSLRSIVERKLSAGKYSPVHAHDVDPERFSSDDQDEVKHKLSLSCHCISVSIWRLAFLLAATAISSAILSCLMMQRHESHNLQQQLMKTPIPEMPKEIRIFKSDETFTAPPNEENNKAWDDLLPPGRGYVFVENGTSYGLEPGVETQYGEIYSVAMYHQMHCLGLIRRNYWQLIQGILNHDAGVLDDANEQILRSHTGHCFDYFRQSIECSADMSLEWPRTDADGRRYQVDGNNIPHVCVSKMAIDEYMHAHHFNGSHNHDIAA